MTSKDLKICPKCHKLVDRTTHKCPVAQREKMERDKRLSKNEIETEKLLRTKRWHDFRNYIILMDGGECQRCLIKFHKHVYDNLTIQHIKPRVLYPELMFDVDNCVTLCMTCNLTLGLKGLDFDWNPKKRKNLMDEIQF